MQSCESDNVNIISVSGANFYVLNQWWAEAIEIFSIFNEACHYLGMWSRKYLKYLLQSPNFVVTDGISLRIPRSQFFFWRNNNDDEYCYYNDFFHQGSKYFINQSYSLVQFQGKNKALFFLSFFLLTKISRLKLKHIFIMTSSTG